MSKRRPYPADVQLEVEAANRENREVELSDDQLAQLGHRKRNPVETMRKFCLGCMAGNAAEVRRCTSPGCALFPYRLGKNPFSGRKGRAGIAVRPVGSLIQPERAEQPADSSNASKAGVS